MPILDATERLLRRILSIRRCFGAGRTSTVCLASARLFGAISAVCAVLATASAHAEIVFVSIQNNTGQSLTVRASGQDFRKAGERVLGVAGGTVLPYSRMNILSVDRSVRPSGANPPGVYRYDFRLGLAGTGATYSIAVQDPRSGDLSFGGVADGLARPPRLLMGNSALSTVLSARRSGPSPFVVTVRGAVHYEPEFPLLVRFVDYIVSGPSPTLETGGRDRLNVLSYNMHLLAKPAARLLSPLGGHEERSDAMVKHLLDHDVIVASELQSASTRDRLVNRLRSELARRNQSLWISEKIDASTSFPPSLLIPSRRPKAEAGVHVISRWPIVHEDLAPLVFSRCGSRFSGDCFADKGAKYVVIEKLGRRYNIFATHLVAGDGRTELEVRRSQLRELREYIDSQNIPRHEPIIIAGDLNIDRFNPAQFAEMLSILQARMPVTKLGHRFTSDGAINTMKNKDTRTFLDYVLYDENHARPIKATSTTVVFREDQPWTIRPHVSGTTGARGIIPELKAIFLRHRESSRSGTVVGTHEQLILGRLVQKVPSYEISDHYGVWAELNFAPSRLDVFARNERGDLIQYFTDPTDDRIPSGRWAALNLSQANGFQARYRIAGSPVPLVQRYQEQPFLSLFSTSLDRHFLRNLVQFSWQRNTGWRALDISALTNGGAFFDNDPVVIGWAEPDIDTIDLLGAQIAGLGPTDRVIPRIDVFGTDRDGHLMRFRFAPEDGWRFADLTAAVGERYALRGAVAATFFHRPDGPSFNVFGRGRDGDELINYFGDDTGFRAESLTERCRTQSGCAIGQGADARDIPAVAQAPVALARLQDGVRMIEVFVPTNRGIMRYVWRSPPGGWTVENLGAITDAPGTVDRPVIAHWRAAGVEGVNIFARTGTPRSRPGAPPAPGRNALIDISWNSDRDSWVATNMTKTLSGPSLHSRPVVASHECSSGVPCLNVFAVDSFGRLLEYAWAFGSSWKTTFAPDPPVVREIIGPLGAVASRDMEKPRLDVFGRWRSAGSSAPLAGTRWISPPGGWQPHYLTAPVIGGELRISGAPVPIDLYGMRWTAPPEVMHAP